MPSRLGDGRNRGRHCCNCYESCCEEVVYMFHGSLSLTFYPGQCIFRTKYKKRFLDFARNDKEVEE